MPNETINKLSEESPSVQMHLGIIQNVIERMATNSSLAKSWCITIVSAILVVVADKSKPDYALIALVPAILFLMLDAYYLGMEKGFRNSYNVFVKRLHKNLLTADDLFSVKPTGSMWHLEWEAMCSVSVWGFYSFLAIMILLARYVLLG